MSEMEVAMQKWEYLFLKSEDGRPRYVNGKEIPNWQAGPTLSDAVKHLMGKGWALMATPLIYLSYLDSPMSKYSLIFRRLEK